MYLSNQIEKFAKCYYYKSSTYIICWLKIQCLEKLNSLSVTMQWFTFWLQLKWGAKLGANSRSWFHSMPIITALSVYFELLVDTCLVIPHQLAHGPEDSDKVFWSSAAVFVCLLVCSLVTEFVGLFVYKTFLPPPYEISELFWMKMFNSHPLKWPIKDHSIII